MTKQNTSGRLFNRLLKGLCIVSAICISSLGIAVDTDNDGLAQMLEEVDMLISVDRQNHKVFETALERILVLEDSLSKGPLSPPADEILSRINQFKADLRFVEAIKPNKSISCGQGESCYFLTNQSDRNIGTSVTNVFSNGEVASAWDGGINAADSGINWSVCSNDGGEDCPNIAWEIVQDPDRGGVLQVTHSSVGQLALLYFKTSIPIDFTDYSGGQLIFDIKTVSGDSNYSMKVDCIFPCTSSDQNIGIRGVDDWETVTIQIDDLVEGGLSLRTVDTGIVIWATQYTSTVFQLDNVRWEGELINDTEGPILNAISVDKASVDVSDAPQTITFSVDATDESGIDWEYAQSYVYISQPGGGSNLSAKSSNDAPGIFTISFDSDAQNGAYQILALALRDTQGNLTYVRTSSLIGKGLTASAIEVLGGVEADAPQLNAISMDKVSIDVSGGPQSITYTVDATDESGINWDDTQTYIYIGYPGAPSSISGIGVRSSNQSPGIFTITRDSDDPSGFYPIKSLYLKDTLGNRLTVGASELINMGLPSGFEMIGGVEAVAPILESISLDKASIDTTQNPQAITYSVAASDESGIDWGAGNIGTSIVLNSPGGGYKFIDGDDDTPGIFSASFDSSDPRGRWSINSLYLTDIHGNERRYSSSFVKSLGLPDAIHVLDTDIETTNLTLAPKTISDVVAGNSEFTFDLDITNLASIKVDELYFELSSTNMRVTRVSSSGATACGITSVNYDSTVTCAMSGVDARSVKSISIDFEVAEARTGVFHSKVISDDSTLLDISYLDNHLSKTITILDDSDGDGVSDPTDNCPDNENLDQSDADADGIGDVCDDDIDGDDVLNEDDAFPLDAEESLDTDSDGIGNNADTDDDNDGVPDTSDALPLDVSESVDTDGDGIGNNADTDDDNDGISDLDDYYPSIALDGLVDTDGDGIPDACDALCQETGMLDDLDDDNDGTHDERDAFPLDDSETMDTDTDGLGNNADPDDDNDGVQDTDDVFPLVAYENNILVSDLASSKYGTLEFAQSYTNDPDIRLGFQNSSIHLLPIDDNGQRLFWANQNLSPGTWLSIANGYELIWPTSPFFNSYCGEDLVNYPHNLHRALTENRGFDCISMEFTVRSSVRMGVISKGDKRWTVVYQAKSEYFAAGDTLVIDPEKPIYTELGDVRTYQILAPNWSDSLLNNAQFDESEVLGTWMIGGINLDILQRPEHENSSVPEPDRCINSGFCTDLVTFEGGGIGKTELSGRDISWSLTASGSISIIFEDTGVHLEVTRLEKHTDSSTAQITSTQWGNGPFISVAQLMVKKQEDVQLDDFFFEDYLVSGNYVANPNPAVPRSSLDNELIFLQSLKLNADNTGVAVLPMGSYELFDYLEEDLTWEYSIGGPLKIRFCYDSYLYGQPVPMCDYEKRIWLDIVSVTDDRIYVVDTYHTAFSSSFTRARPNFYERAPYFDPEDIDRDGVSNENDVFPIDPLESSDLDGDGIGDNSDQDRDGDGVANQVDGFPEVSIGDLIDTDNDGIPDACDSDCQGLGMEADDDDDGDGVADVNDSLPLDPTNDSDGDGVSNNNDRFPENSLYSQDTDFDGMPDSWETRYGLDPNDASDATSDQDNDGVTALDEFLAGTIPSGSLDIDGNEDYDALTDGLLLLRGMFGLDGSALVTGTIASDAAYTESVDIESRIEALGELADIDGNGQIDALTDGLLTLRYLFGLQGDTLINGVVAGDATRTTSEEIEAHLETLMPAL